MEGGSKGDSWPPSTPLKDIMQMMHPKMQDIEVEWMGLGRRITPGFGDDLNAFPEKGKSVMVSDNGEMGIEHEFEALEGITFSDLLGLRDVAPAQGNGGIGGQSGISIENLQTGSSFSGMLLSGHCLVPGSTVQSNGGCTTENSGVSVPHKHSYDLNFAPDMEGNTVSGLDIARFAPITPEKPGNAEIDQVAEIQNLHVCEQINQERNDNEGGVIRIDDNSTEGPSQPVTDSSGPVVSTPLKDNQHSDDGGNKKKPRRRKHRPKIAIEGKKPKKDSKPVTSKSGGSKDNLRVKRKYVRRKGVNKTTTLSEEPSGVLADSATLQPPRNSCRRALDFNTPEQQCGSSAPKSVTNLDSESRVQSKSSVQVSQQTELTSENIQAGFAYDLTCSMNQVLSTSFQMNRNTSEEILDVEKGRVTVHDKQEGTANNVLENKNQTALGSAGANEEVQARRSKRKYSHVIEQASNTNRNGAHYNSLQAYEHWLHIPNACKKKRSEKGAKSVTLSTSSHLNEMKTATWPSIMCSNSDSKAYTFAAKANYWSSTPPQPTTSQVPAILRKSGRQGLEAKQPTKLHLMALTEPERGTNEASSTPTRVCELAPMNRSAACQAQTTSSAIQGSVSGTKNLQILHACQDLVADMQPTVAKRKRSKKRSSFTSINKTQLHQQIAVHQFSTEPSAFNAGAAAEVINQGFIDVITERLKYLNINSESHRVIFQERDALVHYNQDQNALVPYNQDRNAYIPYNQHQNALVLYRSDGTIVPFQGPCNPIKTKRPRPKVDLDEETNRVFQLLLENINSEGVDGTDEEKRKWWEEERRVFCGRADSFVARMHLVQGDRRFSQWKGSVVDSVVGVFLTQNVTDHLSSSAFLSLAARYPLKSNSNHKPLHEEETTFLVKDAEVFVPDPDTEQTTEWKENTSNQRDSDQSSMTLHDNEYNEEKEVVSSNVSPGNKTAEVILTEKISCSSINSSESDVETYHKITRTETSSFAPYDIATNDVVSSQISLNIVEYPIAQTSERSEPYSENNLEAEKLKNRLQVNNLNDSTSLMDLLSMGGSTCKCDMNYKDVHSSSDQSIVTEESTSQGTVQEKVTVTVQESPTSYSENNQSSNFQGEENMIQSRNWFVGDTNAETLARGLNNKEQDTLNLPNLSGETLDITESTSSDKRGNNKQKTAVDKALESAKQKNRRVGREINNEFEWDTLRREVEANGKKERLSNTIDSLDWEAVRCADVNEIAETIKERGMNNVLAARIKAFLNRVVNDHGSIDLEWLRDIEADKAKEYLLSIRGLGLKSVECVRLLTLQHLAFPVDTNVGRIAVRLGWVPLQPLPDSLQLHLLELYPVMESIQRYLWPRLCKLKQEELYELHYQMITFGKVFCTKTKPNCNACPMRGECRHFASAFASGRLALPAPEEKSIVSVPEKTTDPDTTLHTNALPLPPPQPIQPLEGNLQLEAILTMDKKCVVGSCEPIIEQPASPEPESTQYQECDIEDSLYDDSDDIPIIKLNIEEFTQNLQHYIKDNMELQEGEMSKALVALTPEAASIPMPKLKNVSRLRTEHQVYELPDSHPLLEGMDKREPDDPCTYLLAIWAPGETANSVQPSEGGCSYQESGKLCDRKTCFLCNSIREANSQMVRGTLLIPCRTATRGRFPLNGTYFQVNEVFADHASSLNPIDIPRQWLWNLPRKTVFFGTSVSSIFKGLSTEEIQHCFWRGHVCVRGFDHKIRAPRPLVSRLHSSLAKAKGKTVDE